MQLSFIPGLSHLTSLALPGLNLSLESVPDLAALTALQRLELQGNALRSLPDSFLQQHSLLTYGVHADVLLQLQQLGMCTALVEDTMLSRLLTQAQQQKTRSRLSCQCATVHPMCRHGVNSLMCVVHPLMQTSEPVFQPAGSPGPEDPCKPAQLD